jgi:putative DNA-invertase from lambdoid prophage Rac
MATFAYGRVSTSLQETENQRLELANAGWKIDYWFADIPGSLQAQSGVISRVQINSRL